MPYARCQQFRCRDDVSSQEETETFYMDETVYQRHSDYIPELEANDMSNKERKSGFNRFAGWLETGFSTFHVHKNQQTCCEPAAY